MSDEHGAVNLDDGPEIAKGPETAAEKEAAAARAADPDMEVVDGVADARPRDHAVGRPQQGVAIPPPLADADPGPPMAPIDRAGGAPQVGIPSDPDPICIGSGMKASEMAEIAYNCVQSYKEVIGQQPTWYCDRSTEVQGQIVESVAEFLRGNVMGAAQMHEIWRLNTVGDREVPAAVEEDPRLGQAWLDMDPTESRKGLIFQHVLNALVRPF